jgi:D-arginine dehydrogenase
LAVGAAAGEFAAPLLSHAAGAWADAVVRMAEVTPIGIEPYCRTLISFVAPSGEVVRVWLFTKTVGEGFSCCPWATRGGTCFEH